MPLPFRTVASNPSEVSTVGTIEEVLQTAAPTTGRLQTASIEGNLGHRLRSYDQSPSPGFAFSKPQQTPRSLAVKRTTLPFAEVRSVEPALPPFPIRLENKPVAIAGETHTANALPRRAIAGTYSALPPLPAAVAVKPEDHYCKLPSRTAPFKHIASPLAPSAAIAGFPSTAAAPGWGVGAMNGPRMGPRPSNSALQTTYGPHGLSPYKLVRSEARQCAKHRPTGCLPHTYKPESFAYPSKQGDFSVPYGHHNPIFRSDNVQGPRPTYRQGKMMRAYVDKTPGLTRRVSDDFGRDVNVTSHPPFDAVSRYSSQSSTELTNSSRVTADRNNLDRLRRKYPRHEFPDYTRIPHKSHPGHTWGSCRCRQCRRLAELYRCRSQDVAPADKLENHFIVRAAGKAVHGVTSVLAASLDLIGSSLQPVLCGGPRRERLMEAKFGHEAQEGPDFLIYQKNSQSYLRNLGC